MKAKKVYIVIVILVVIGVIIGVFLIFNKSNPRIEIKQHTFEFEYGSPITIKEEDLFADDYEKVKDLKVDYTTLDYNQDIVKVNNYKVKVSYIWEDEKKEDSITIKVNDTTPPKIVNNVDVIEVELNAKAIDYSKYIEVSDLSKVNLTFDDTNLNLNKLGEYIVDIKAIDAYDNESTSSIKVMVNEKQLEQKQGEPYYVGDILIVNKKHPLPASYAPNENETAGNAIRLLIKDMQDNGYDISDSYSGYRSYEYQQQLYQNYVATYGQESADTFSARAGYSEHQSGLAFDLLHYDGSLVTKEKEANWLVSNAHRYGFIVRYQEGKEAITGYQGEPWHLRYIGDEAEAIYKSKLTLEEYLGVPGGDY